MAATPENLTPKELDNNTPIMTWDEFAEYFNLDITPVSAADKVNPTLHNIFIDDRPVAGLTKDIEAVVLKVPYAPVVDVDNTLG